MRLSPAVPTLAGLLLAWAVAAQADAPPAAPIFYCPTPGKTAPAAPAKAPAKPVAAPMVHASAPPAQGCPTMRVAAGHPVVEHHYMRRAERHFAVAPPPPAQVHRHQYAADADVSAAQAFIYRYERAAHGFDAGAADQAWAEGRRGPPMGGHFLAQRQTPPPPCPHGCPGPDAWRHAGAPPMMAERAPPPLMSQRGPPMPATPAPQSRAYAWQDGQAGGGYSIQRSERAGGWSYSEQDGQGRYRQWGDHFPGEPGHGWAGHDDHGQRWAEGPPRGPCPHACPAGPRGHAEVYETAGRDAAGFLTWPGKTPGW
jgi:hypothetical protein